MLDIFFKNRSFMMLLSFQIIYLKICSSMDIIFIIISLVLLRSEPRIVKLPTNIQAKHITFYANLHNNRQTYKFSSSFRNIYNDLPILVYGISDYYLGAIFPYQYVDSGLCELTISSFSINVYSFGETNNMWFSISYIAIQKGWAFTSDYVSGSNISNSLNKTSSQQFIVINKNLVFNSGKNICLPMLVGFSWTNKSDFGFSVTVNMVSTSIYYYEVYIPPNFTIQSIKFYILFCDQVGLASNSYYYVGNQYSVLSSNHSLSSFSISVDYYEETVILLALRGFFGLNKLANRKLGWRVTNILNDSAHISIEKISFTKVYFSYLQIGKIPLDERENGTDFAYYLLVVGSILGVAVVLIGICIYKKCRKTAASRDILSRQNLRSFPTLSFY